MTMTAGFIPSPEMQVSQIWRVDTFLWLYFTTRLSTVCCDTRSWLPVVNEVWRNLLLSDCISSRGCL